MEDCRTGAGTTVNCLSESPTYQPSGDVPALLQDPNVIDDLREACGGMWLRTAEQYEALARAGWTGSEIDRLRALGTWVLQHDTGLTRYVNAAGGEWVHAVIMEEFITYRNDITGGLQVADPRTVLAWLICMASEPPGNAVLSITWLIFDSVDRQYMNMWLRLGDAGALAHAAGLTLDEAEQHLTRPDAQLTLHTLAALRGFTFPPVTLFPADSAPTWLRP